jgi:hypothetical protein
MFSQNFLPYLKFHLNFGNFFGINIVNFCPLTKKFVISSSKKRREFYRLNILLHLLHLLALFLNLCVGPLTTLKKLQGAIFCSIEFVSLVLRWDLNLDLGPVQLINSFIKFEENLLKGIFLIFNFTRMAYVTMVSVCPSFC